MKELSGAMLTLRTPEQIAPPPGFYSRVARHVDAQRPRSFWSFIWLEPSFGKRVAFASLMTLAILGSYLISREGDYSAGPSRPEVILAQHKPADDADMMLATLASYEP
jgi:hypothetical protein